jgi:hypothetical protein
MCQFSILDGGTIKAEQVAHTFNEPHDDAQRKQWIQHYLTAAPECPIYRKRCLVLPRSDSVGTTYIWICSEESGANLVRACEQLVREVYPP